MPDATAPKLDGFVLNVSKGLPDNRDWFYTSSPIQSKAEQDFPTNLIVRNQESKGACTGFWLATVINLLDTNGGHAFAIVGYNQNNDLSPNPKAAFVLAPHLVELWQPSRYALQI